MTPFTPPLTPTRAASAPAQEALPVDRVEVAAVGEDPRPWSAIQCPPKKLETLPDGRLHVDTVRWGFKEEGRAQDWPGIFSDATIDPKHVKNVYLGVKPFAPELLAAHSVLIFEMDEQHPVTDSRGRQDSGLVLSMEARLHQGEQYKLLKTLNGKYGVVYQLGTFNDLVEKSTRREPHRLIRYRLDLDDKQKQQLLLNTLEASCADRPQERYNLFTNSCHSSVIDLVDSVVPEGQKMHRWLLPHVYNPMAAFPPYGDILFAGHHLLAHEQRLVIQPDDELHPGAQKGPTRTGLAVEKLSSSRAWKPLCGLAGALAGTAVGAALHFLPPQVAIPLAAGGGAYLGVSLGETLKRRTHTEFASSRSYYRAPTPTPEHPNSA